MSRRCSTAIGVRLDHSPEVLFVLRQVDHNDLIVAAGQDVALGAKAPADGKRLDDTGLAEMFGIELASPAAVPEKGAMKRATKKKSAPATAKKAGRKKLVVGKAGAERRKSPPAGKAVNTPRRPRRVGS